MSKTTDIQYKDYLYAQRTELVNKKKINSKYK